MYRMLCILLVLLAATEATAQQMPERSLVRKGNRQYNKGEYGEAIKRYEEALKAAPESFEATYNLGNALYKAERFDTAEQTILRATADTLRTDDELAETYYNLGNAQFKQKKYKEALESYKQSLRLNPSDMEAKYNYAYTKRLLDDQNKDGGGGGNDQQNQNQDQNQNQQNQNGQGQQNPQQGDNKQQQGDNNPDKKQDGNPQQQPAKPDNSQGDKGDGEGQPTPSGISPQEQEQMLDAIQAQEDKTQEKLKEKRQGVVVRGKKKLVKRHDHAFRITPLSVAADAARTDDRLLRLADDAGRRRHPDLDRRGRRTRPEERALLPAPPAFRTAGRRLRAARRRTGPAAADRTERTHLLRRHRHHAGHRRLGLDAGPRLRARPHHGGQGGGRIVHLRPLRRPHRAGGLCRRSLHTEPLTTDQSTLQTLLAQIRSGLIDDSGTAIGNGLATAINRLRESDAKSKVVILLTDGVNNRGEITPITAAEIARAQNIRVYTIGVGTEGMAPYPAVDMFGNITFVKQKVEIDEKTLTAMAGMTGGRYFRATDNAKLKAIYDEINQLEKSKVEVTEHLSYHEQFLAWVLAALGLLLAEFLLVNLVLKRIP